MKHASWKYAGGALALLIPLGGCDFFAKPKQPPSETPATAESQPLDLKTLEGHVVALGAGPAWRLDADPQAGVVLSLLDQGLDFSGDYGAPSLTPDGGAQLTGGEVTLTLTPESCLQDGATYPMRASVQLQQGAPLSGCAFVRWDRRLTELLPAIDSCLSLVTVEDVIRVSYAAQEPGGMVLVRLNGGGEAHDCRAPLDPEAGPAIITPGDPNLKIGGDGDALFVRAPGENPGGECYEAPEVRAADGSLIGWLDDPQGC